MTMMLGLEFASGTTEDSKRLVAGLFQPGEILGAYRQGRTRFKTSDLVMVASQSEASGFNVEPRIAYLKRLRQNLGSHASRTMPALGITDKSAHAVAQLPFESEAMWLIVTRGKELPVMCVLYVLPYETTTAPN